MKLINNLRRKKSILALSVFLVILVFVAWKSDVNHGKYHEKKDKQFWKAATYFSNEWVMNFWNSEMDNIDFDFTQIKKDGFNSIILVIPWHEFQPNIDPVKYNQYALDKLEWVMEKAESHGLGVITRLGYVWDFYNDLEDSNIRQRYYFYLTDSKVQNAWNEYLNKLNSILSKYKTFKGAFITWEDWWGCVDTAKNLEENSEENLRIAEEIGYQDYMISNYSLKEIQQILNNKSITEKTHIFIPSSQRNGFSTFYDFYDRCLNQLLIDSQKIIPDLSMEVRVDQDPVYDKDGNSTYYNHENTYDCKNSSYTTIVYGIPMGFENQGERVTADEALEKTNYVLDQVNRVTGNKRLFIDQFLFYDNTPQFSYNAQLKLSEINEYLEKSAKVLNDKTNGYGIWTYRDYDSNMIYNPQFALGEAGWEIEGNAQILNQGSNKLVLQAGSCLKQKVSLNRNHFKNDYVIVEFDLEIPGSQKTDIIVKVGDTKKRLGNLKTGKITKKFKDTGNYDLSIIADKKIIIDNVKLYSFTQNGLLYDRNGEPLQCLNGMKKLNRLTENYLIRNKRLEESENLLAKFRKENVKGYLRSDDYPWKENVAMIDIDTKSRGLFLSPDVSVEFAVDVTEDNNVLFLEYGMHPQSVGWGISDGAILKIVLKDLEENFSEVLKELAVVPSEVNFREVEIMLDQYIGKKVFIDIACLPGAGGNYEGDWVLIKRMALM